MVANLNVGAQKGELGNALVAVVEELHGLVVVLLLGADELRFELLAARLSLLELLDDGRLADLHQNVLAMRELVDIVAGGGTHIDQILVLELGPAHRVDEVERGALIEDDLDELLESRHLDLIGLVVLLEIAYALAVLVADRLGHEVRELVAHARLALLQRQILGRELLEAVLELEVARLDLVQLLALLVVQALRMVGALPLVQLLDLDGGETLRHGEHIVAATVEVVVLLFAPVVLLDESRLLALALQLVAQRGHLVLVGALELLHLADGGRSVLARARLELIERLAVRLHELLVLAVHHVQLDHGHRLLELLLQIADAKVGHVLVALQVADALLHGYFGLDDLDARLVDLLGEYEVGLLDVVALELAALQLRAQQVDLTRVLRYALGQRRLVALERLQKSLFIFVVEKKKITFD